MSVLLLGILAQVMRYVNDIFSALYITVICGLFGSILFFYII
jgi:hypothetical protein